MKNIYLLNFLKKFLNIFLIFIIICSISFVIPTKVNAGDKTYSQTLKSGIEAFPESYQVLLKKLIEETDHTNWNFQAYYTGIEWEDFIAGQAKCGKNRIHQAFDTAYRASCNNLASGYYCADENITAYFVDPRNFITERNIFQFLEISYNEELYTKSIVEEMIKGYKVFNNGKEITFKMSDENHQDYNKEVTMTFADIIMEAATKSQMSPISIVTKIVQEVGSSGSASTTGTNETYPSCYNYFNIGAYDTGDAIINGLKYADNAGWHCPYTSIVEGATYNSKNYIQEGQNTLYFYKFDCVGNKILKVGEEANITSSNLYHQYMTNVYDPYTQSITYFSTYTNNGLLDKTLNFIIPVYENMPEYVEKPSTLLTNEDQDFYYADITSTCYTRTGPGTNYDRQTVQYKNASGNTITADLLLYKDDIVIMLERKSANVNGYTWDKVQFWNGKIGYVPTEYLEKYTKTNEDGEKDPIEIPTSAEKVIGFAYADVSSSLNIRKGAGSTYSIIGSLSAKEEFEVLEETTDWYKIKTNKDIIGYVAKEYTKKLEYIKQEENIIKVIPPVTPDILAQYLGVDKYTVKKGEEYITDGILGTNYIFTAGDKEYVIIKTGDVNGDGRVNTGDAFLIQKYAIKTHELKDNFLTAGHINNDTKVNTVDAFLIQKYAVKLQPISL